MSNGRNLHRLLLLLALMGMVAAAATSALADDDDDDDNGVSSDTRIAFGSLNRDGNDGTGFDIWTIDPANPTDITPVTNAVGDETVPRWSPDGSQIAY